jgi:hypothetical protein
VRSPIPLHPDPLIDYSGEIATMVSPDAHAVIILDQAGWHGAKELNCCYCRRVRLS